MLASQDQKNMEHNFPVESLKRTLQLAKVTLREERGKPNPTLPAGSRQPSQFSA